MQSELPDVLEAHSPYLATAAVVACGRGSARIRTSFWHTDHIGTYVRPVAARYLKGRAASALETPLWRLVRVLLAPFDATFVAGVAQTQRLRVLGVKNVVYAPFGVDTRTFRPAARDPMRRRELLGPHAGPLLVGVGRFAVEKRWDVVLDAFARLRSRHEYRGATLGLFGDGPERQRLQERAGPGVLFFGFETDRLRLASALASADLLVHGSPYETFGIGIVEAVACGLPVVAPDAGGAGERVDPSCGETYPSLDAEACTAAMERILARDCEELRASALRAAATVPTLEQHVAHVVSVYDELLRARPSGVRS
jgi:alpha-1,6-mannosyltransferase